MRQTEKAKPQNPSFASVARLSHFGQLQPSCETRKHSARDYQSGLAESSRVGVRARGSSSRRPLAAPGCLAADLLTAFHHLHPAIPCWNLIVRLGLFVVVAPPLSALPVSQERRENWRSWPVPRAAGQGKTGLFTLQDVAGATMDGAQRGSSNRAWFRAVACQRSVTRCWIRRYERLDRWHCSLPRWMRKRWQMVHAIKSWCGQSSIG